MRLWHYKLIPYLPKSQLIAQWRELNSIYKKQDKHILINYIYEYPDNDLNTYSLMVMRECRKRGIKIRSINNYYNYFGLDKTTCLDQVVEPFKNHHTDRYLMQCFYNLQEKYDRGQKDFSKLEYDLLEAYICNRIARDRNERTTFYETSKDYKEDKNEKR